ncbi:multiple organellar RNA editing factor 8, chloroplastic/mitochondrial isoform X2 [Rhodamnia argentea]|uniref:Multiple organellar RNA editing factor 8, chloroplastic/mitochondrial isoform X2 n=1 Tax=Rhodamnia argentea TaxID=178133 RepID=A0ABM3H0K8_9MYRT|nr:multiple organellar RNA editing factor 8, chloroplastic/mitochondrial isoform X2 [Rhodamnia argentea]
MATQLFTRSLLLSKPKQALAYLLSRSLSFSSAPASAPRSPLSLSAILRPLSAASAEFRHRVAVASSARSFATRSTHSSLNDPNPNWSNRPPKETILLDGCDFEHWLVVMEKPEGDPTRDEIIDSYIKTLAQVVGSVEEARMKIYSVSTRHYFAFGALVSEELSYKLKDLPRVRWVLPDSYLDVRNKDYGGEPFINGQAVPYDPKYHEEWVRNNARANERNRRNDRPRNFDRSRNFDRRRENMQNRDFQARDMPPLQNQGMQNPPPQGNMPPPNMGGGMPPPGNFGGVPPHNQGGMPPPSNFGGMPPHNQGGMPPSNYGGMPPRNQDGMPPNNFGGMPPNMGGMPPQNNMGGMQHQNMGGMPPQNNIGGPPRHNMGEMPSQSNMGGMPHGNTGGMPPQDMGAAPKMEGYSQNQGWSNTTPQRDAGTMPNYQSQNYTASRDPSTVPGGNAY